MREDCLVNLPIMSEHVMPKHVQNELMKLHGIEFHSNKIIAEQEIPGEKSYAARVTSLITINVNTEKVIVFGESIIARIRVSDSAKFFLVVIVRILLHYVKPTSETGYYDTAIIHLTLTL